MHSAIDPLTTVFRDDPDMDHSDELREAEMLGQRNRILEDVLDNKEDLDVFLDCLAEQGIDPIAWLNAAAASMQYVIDSGIVFHETPTGLLLPG